MLKTISKKLAFIPAFIFVSVAAIAQETKKIDIDINTKDEPQWYMQPWAWVVGGVLLLLILIALFRGGGTDRTVTKTTIIREQ